MTRCWTWQGHCSDQIFLHFSSEPKNWILTTFQNAYKEKPMPWCKTQQATRAPQLFVLFVIWSRSWILIIWPEYCGKFSGMSIFVKTEEKKSVYPISYSYIFVFCFLSLFFRNADKSFGEAVCSFGNRFHGGFAGRSKGLQVTLPYCWICHCCRRIFPS